MTAQHYLPPDAEAMAKRFHELYEHHAPTFNYKTRTESSVPWDQVPENNKQLMVQVCRDIIRELRSTCDQTCFDEGCDCNY